MEHISWLLTLEVKILLKRRNKYVGTYIANYDNYSGEETIFGVTALSRKNGEHIKVKIEKESGNINVIAKLGNNETTLINDTGEYEDNIY